MNNPMTAGKDRQLIKPTMNTELEKLIKRQRELEDIRGPQKEALGRNRLESLRVFEELKKPMPESKRKELWQQRVNLQEARIILENALSKTSTEVDEIKYRLHAASKPATAETINRDQALEDIKNLRDEFKEFSLDPMRVRSARKMAAEFVERLNQIIAINKAQK